MSKFRAQEIIPNLWLGDRDDARYLYYSNKPHAIACMHEELPRNTPHQKWFPLGQIGFDGDISEIEFDQLEAACDLIDKCLDNQRPILVHCYAGVERSPLTVAWYLYTRKHFQTLSAAYTFIMSKRSIVQDRTIWLPEDIRLKLVGVTGAEPSNNAAV